MCASNTRSHSLQRRRSGRHTVAPTTKLINIHVSIDFNPSECVCVFGFTKCGSFAFSSGLWIYVLFFYFSLEFRSHRFCHPNANAMRSLIYRRSAATVNVWEVDVPKLHLICFSHSSSAALVLWIFFSLLVRCSYGSFELITSKEIFRILFWVSIVLFSTNWMPYK